MWSESTFLLVCSTEIEYKEKYDSKLKHNSQIAPYISLIGTLDEPQYFMIDFENLSYKVFSFSRALDISF